MLVFQLFNPKVELLKYIIDVVNQVRFLLFELFIYIEHNVKESFSQ